MAQHPQPPAKPPASPPPRPQASQPPHHAGSSQQPLEPPLPPATSAPDRQGPPNPSPRPDEPPRDQRLRDNPNEFGVDRATLTPEQRTGLVTEPHLPQKFRRPLPQPGDSDYVVGQPVNEEEAQRMEQVEQDRYDYAIKAGKDAEANRAPDEALDKQHPASPPPKHPEGGEPLHKPGHHRGDDKDR